MQPRLNLRLGGGQAVGGALCQTWGAWASGDKAESGSSTAWGTVGGIRVWG